MKSILKNIILTVLSAVLLISCNEKVFLEEVPMSFLSPENAYVTKSDFDMALNHLYAKVRDNFYNSGTNNCFELFMGTDVAKNARNNNNFVGNLTTWMIPEQAVIANVWDREYKLIADANTVIDRVEASSLSQEQKDAISAEAKFFRAFGYRTLVYLFGGVPLILQESTSPRSDYVRDTKAHILEAMRDDFAAAAAGLPAINKVAGEGRVSDLVAKFYYAETLMSLGDNKTAITLLTEVINNSNVALMTQRFGTHKDEDGDVFWDLFRVKNQNRSSGNKEALWVIQMETDVIGGFLVSSQYRPWYLERFAAPVTFSLTDPDGKTAMLCTNGRSTLNIGGRGSANMCNTDWWLNDLWESDWNNDIRNSKYNIIRDAYYDDPKSAYYGKSVIGEDSYSAKLKTDWWRWFPWPSKVTTPGDHPDALYTDSVTKALSSKAGATYLDQYMLRLPEVYLLRAEAYLNSNEKGKAAEDINIVRTRANAKPIEDSSVSLDYILDERAREMVYEEFRRITLGRVGKYVERVRKCNSYNGPQIKDHMELFPIPYSAIEANKDAVLEQNPGYAN